MPAIAVDHASSEDEHREARALFEEYAASLDFDLCFQGFDNELAALPGRYAPPSGRLLLARFDGAAAGCVALRKIEDRVCEMKRLFVRSAFLGRGIGRKLTVAIIEEARDAGYETLKLDTVPAMREAISLYESLGFRETSAYTNNPVEGVRFLALRL